MLFNACDSTRRSRSSSQIRILSKCQNVQSRSSQGASKPQEQHRGSGQFSKWNNLCWLQLVYHINPDKKQPFNYLAYLLTVESQQNLSKSTKRGSQNAPFLKCSQWGMNPCGGQNKVIFMKKEVKSERSRVLSLNITMKGPFCIMKTSSDTVSTV